MSGTHIALASIGIFILTMKATAGRVTSPGADLEEGMVGTYFSADEVVSSNTASAHNIDEQFDPPESVWDAAYLLSSKVLDPIRTWLGHPVTVESWYRSPELTEALLSAGEDTVKNTTHVTGGTADVNFFLDGMNKSNLIVRAALVLHLPFDRLLIEHGTLQAPDHIHIEYDPTKSASQQRRQIWRIDHGSHGKQKSIAWAEEQYL